MSPKLDSGSRGPLGPGPIYQVRGYTEHGKDSQPAFSIVSRHFLEGNKNFQTLVIFIN